MAEVKKIATRESYGNALAELGKEYPNLVVYMQILLQQLRPAFSKRHFRIDILTVVSQSVTW